ncbi:MAG: Jag N-terminal domain-containing protein [Desulfobulbus sp.]|jgi:spoIIIJ-associated protein|uniref:Jag family protein n=1 Tax=Desulfobulbus sp. TaxID=895 RepID=UPI002848F5C8|nr:Jag N-terminal domain-containing protein [Desulfobulbus sp.]MDR2550610.1 Jag N-terminal domain-containing protein [Desulfobulbus sp.]
MAKGQDFYGKDIAEVIERACKTLEASREDLDIEVLETGSAGIFGLCKKKAHIRVQRKVVSLIEEIETKAAPAEKPAAPEKPAPKPVLPEKVAVTEAPDKVDASGDDDGNRPLVQTPAIAPAATPATGPKQREDDDEQDGEPEDFEEETLIEPPSEESLAAIQVDLHQLLSLMGLPSEVRVAFADNTVLCAITGPHEAHIVGPEGRTLDSLQYLLRKMVAKHLPDKIMLSLNAGDFRERRTEELKLRAVELATQVKADGKTQAIPALNPSERRVVHMVLQEDKGVRSRSVGEGLFKKVLIYKPGKGRRSAPKKRRGGQGGRPSGD